jgi:hypothetical protein
MRDSPRSLRPGRNPRFTLGISEDDGTMYASYSTVRLTGKNREINLRYIDIFEEWASESGYKSIQGEFGLEEYNLHAEKNVYKLFVTERGYEPDVIGISNIKGPCPACQDYFGRTGTIIVYFDAAGNMRVFPPTNILTVPFFTIQGVQHAGRPEYD